MLEAKEVTVLFSARGIVIPAVDEASITAEKGKIIGLVGESGSGKTTLLRVLLGLQKVDKGEVLFNGANIFKLKSKKLKEFRRLNQIIFQDPFDSMDPRFRVYDIIAEGLRYHKIAKDKNEEKEIIYNTLEEVGLHPADKFAVKYPSQLSGGQLQRVAIARALALNPEIIAADEPVSMLDVSIRASILDIFLNLKQEKNVGFVIVSHDISTLSYISDEIYVMYMGRIVEKGNVDEIIEKPMHPYTQALIASVPVADPKYKIEKIPIKGEISYDHFKYGCRLYPRCPFAMDICAKETPPLIEVSPGHYVACHLIKR